jgi:hypothetical protein
MRVALIVTASILLAPLALAAQPAGSGRAAASLTDISAAKKSKKAKKPKEEYLKAAPGTGPSGPKY